MDMYVHESRSISQVRPCPISYEEFLESDAFGERAEWVDGGVEEMPPVSFRHSKLDLFLAGLLDEFVQAKRLGEVVRAMSMRLSRSGREPDIAFIAAPHLARIRPTHIIGAVDLAVEIVSPESRGQDYVVKLAEYEAAGVREYWIIDPADQAAHFNHLGADGRYHEVMPDATGVYTSTVVVGFWLRVDWLWQDPLPRVSTTVSEILAK